MKVWRFVKDHWRSLLAIVLVFIVCIVFINMLWGNPNLATAFVAFGTLLLVIVTAMTIDNIRAQEKRNRKERWLNEIIEWAEDVANSAISRQKKDKTQLWKTRSDYKIRKVKGTYIKGIAGSHFKDLLSFIKNINSKLDQAISDVEKELGKKTTKAISTKSIRESEENLTKAVERLLEEAAKSKTRAIRQQ
jgi:hypothetical protein